MSVPVFCVGLSHRTAPVEVRERFALTADLIPAALDRLRTAGLIHEAVWLSTCNRVEVYAAGPAGAGPALREWIVRAAIGGVDPGSSLYLLREPHSIEHLFRVASGLDSMVLGETEILGQLKKAYELARQHGHTGGRLNRTFQRAFNVAKQVRSETAIQRGNSSVASVAVELAERVFETVEGRSVLVLGAGDTGEKVTRALVSRGAARVLLFNRTPARAAELAEVIGPPARAIDDWADAARDVDVLVSSTSSAGHVLQADQVARLMEVRHQRPILLIDLAVPRDIDPSVISHAGVYLFNVDDMQAIAEVHRRRREAEVARCEALIRDRASALLCPGSAADDEASDAVSAPA